MSATLRLLAVGMTLPDVASRLSEPAGVRIAVVDLRVELARVRDLVCEQPLLPPARAGFLKGPLLPPAEKIEEARNVDGTNPRLDELRTLAISLLGDQGDGLGDGQAPRDTARQSAALQYAGAVVRQSDLLDELARATSDSSSVHAGLDDDDQMRLRDLLLFLGGGRRLDALIDSWRRQVDALQRRSRGVVYETFTNGLQTRDALENAMTLLTPSGRAIVYDRVSELDQLYLENTLSVSVSIAPPAPWSAQAWWWYRLPRLVSQTFRERLRQVAPAAAYELEHPNA